MPSFVVLWQPRKERTRHREAAAAAAAAESEAAGNYDASI